jgi:hypothetical protein
VGATKVRYRDTWSNVGAAAAWAGVALVFGLSAALGDGSQGPVVRGRGGTAGVLVVGLLVVRCLLRGVVVDGDGVTTRTTWTTTFVPWADVVDAEFGNANDATFTLTDGRRVHVTTVAQEDRPPLQSAYLAVREQWSMLDGWGEPYPTETARWCTVAFIVAAVVLVVGAVVWDDARFDAAHYAERADRERAGVARVMDVDVEVHRHEDGDDTYTTHVAARVRVPGARSVAVDLDRPGNLVARYRAGDEIAVVYDSGNPLDADFGDRPKRRSDESSVEVRSTTGPALFWLGVVGAVGCGSVLAVVRYRRSPRATRGRRPRRA